MITVNLVPQVAGQINLASVIPPADPILNQADQFDLLGNVTVDPLAETIRTIAVSGINVPVPVSVSGGFYRVNSSDAADFTSLPGMVEAGDVVDVLNRASAQFLASVTTELDINGVVDSFRSTVRAPDLTPDAVSFTAITGAQLNEAFTRSFTVSGVEAAVPINNVVNCLYSINGGAPTSSAGTVNNSDEVQLLFNASLQHETLKTISVDVGGVTVSVAVMTVEAPHTEDPAPTPTSAAAFVGPIADIELDEGQSLSLNVSQYFSNVDSYRVDFAPEAQAITISDSGQLSSPQLSAETIRLVVTGVDQNGGEAQSNLFTLIVASAEEAILQGEPIEATVIVEPAHSDGLHNTLYDDNTNAVVVKDIVGQISRARISAPTVTGVIRLEGGGSQALTFLPYKHGYFAPIPDGDYENAILDIAVSASGSIADWEIPFNFSPRTM